ncbi:MAG: VOC family protein [Pseudomonadales bacterium]|nr:VOC family protein [Pseudomonadales bacterium]
MVAEINGIAHIQLSVSDLTKSIPFYRRLLTGMGLTLVNDNESGIYGVGGRTGITISASHEPYTQDGYHQRRPGLHHFCFRARSREDVDEIHEIAIEIGALIVHPPQEDGFAPGYYSVLFEDPDGIRIEANHVPGQGLLAPGLGQVGNADTTWD